jgi:hypothetical protein
LPNQPKFAKKVTLDMIAACDVQALSWLFAAHRDTFLLKRTVGLGEPLALVPVTSDSWPGSSSGSP